MHQLEALEGRRLLAAGALSEQIIINQFGWRASAPSKVAVLADPITGQNSAITYVPGTTFQVRRWSDDATVFTGNLVQWKTGNTDTVSGDRAWHADFSSLTTPGEYYIYDPTNAKRSYAFKLDDNFNNDILNASARTFFYQRSGFDITQQFGGNWNHPASHVGPNQDRAARLRINGVTQAGTERDLSGGWYDAGDFNRYTHWTAGVIWDLLYAFEGNPGAFSDATNIPESGNTVPDILDEVKFELDWLLKMQTNTGAAINRVGNLSYDIGSGPNADTQSRVYTQTTTWATASFAAGVAYAARVFASYPFAYPGYAATLQQAAVNAWSYLQATPNMTPASGADGGDLAAGDANSNANEDRRRRAWAAAELRKTTGQSQYKTYFELVVRNSNLSDNGLHPLLGSWPYMDASNATDLNRVLVTYASTAGADTTLVTDIKTSISHMATDIMMSAYNNKDDPYLAFMWDGHYTWGSNQLKSNWANILQYAIRLNVNPSNNAAYRKAAEEYVNYLHGRNPLSQVYLTNMGSLGADKSVMQLYHGWFQDGSSLYDGSGSTYGPAPGYLAGGPNQYFSVSTISPPANQPPAKSFKDWNTGWPENSWEITEPAIYYQAAYTLLLSAFSTDKSGPTAAMRFNVAAQPTVTLQFSEDIGSSLSPGDLTLQRIGGGGATPSIASDNYIASTRQATIAFSGTVANGNYRLTLTSGSVNDTSTSANASPAAYSLDFFILAGDLNRDRTVNSSDLTVLRTNFGKSNMTWLQGDLTGDGKVTFADYQALTRSLGQAVPSPAPVPVLRAVRRISELLISMSEV